MAVEFDEGVAAAPVESIVITEDQLIMNSIAENVDSNAECLKRLICIIVDALPHTEPQLVELMSEWKRVNDQINEEVKEGLNKIGSF